MRTTELTIVTRGAGVAQVDLVLAAGFTRAQLDHELGFGNTKNASSTERAAASPSETASFPFSPMAKTRALSARDTRPAPDHVAHAPR